MASATFFGSQINKFSIQRYAQNQKIVSVEHGSAYLRACQWELSNMKFQNFSSLGSRRVSNRLRQRPRRIRKDRAAEAGSAWLSQLTKASLQLSCRGATDFPDQKSWKLQGICHLRPGVIFVTKYSDVGTLPFALFFLFKYWILLSTVTF